MMDDLKYTQEHKWLRFEDDGNITVGITDFAQEQLGDVVYVELPKPGDKVDIDQEIALIESVKAAGDISVPLSGTVVAINEELRNAPELVNSSPLSDGWFMTIEPEEEIEVDELMDESTYQEYISSLE